MEEKEVVSSGCSVPTQPALLQLHQWQQLCRGWMLWWGRLARLRVSAVCTHGSQQGQGRVAAALLSTLLLQPRLQPQVLLQPRVLTRKKQ